MGIDWNIIFQSPIVFTTRAPKTGVSFARIAHYASEYYLKEMRFLAYPKYITIELPPGYTIDDSLNLHNTSLTGTHLQVTGPAGSGTRIVKWDVSSIYQINPVTLKPLPAGKWRAPDEKWFIWPRGTLRVDPTAPGFQDTSQLKITCEYYDTATETPYKIPYDDARKGQNLVLTQVCPLIYNFDVKLDATPAEVPSYGPTVVGPQVTLTNNSADALRDVYYFFDGPIRNVTMKQVAGGSTTYTHASTTPNKYGCWVKVADLPANTRSPTPTPCPNAAVTRSRSTSVRATPAPGRPTPRRLLIRRPNRTSWSRPSSRSSLPPRRR